MYIAELIVHLTKSDPKLTEEFNETLSSSSATVIKPESSRTNRRNVIIHKDIHIYITIS